MTPALTAEATAERTAQSPAEPTEGRPAASPAAGPLPDERQKLLIALVHERDAAGTTRLLDSWVHRRGLASLQAFRQGAVPELLSAADDAWLEGCLHQPLERRLAVDSSAPAPFPHAVADPLAELNQQAAAGPEQPLGIEISPSGQGSFHTEWDALVQAVGPEAPLPVPSMEAWPVASFEAEISSSINLEIGVATGTLIPGTGFSAGSVHATPELRGPDQSDALGSDGGSAVIAMEQEGVVAPSAPSVDTAHGDGRRGLALQSPPSQAPDDSLPLPSDEAIAVAAPEPATGPELGAGPQEKGEITPETQATPSRPHGLERGLSTAGAVLADAPQRLRRKFVGSFGKARVLMRACFEEAISTLHPHGEADLDIADPLVSAAPAAAGSAGAPERLASSWPDFSSPAAVASQPASPASPASSCAGQPSSSAGQSTATPAPIGPGPTWVAASGADPSDTDPSGAAPPAAWSRSLSSSLPAASLDLPLHGPPAPAPADLADLRAWLPGPSGQDRRAS